MKRIVGILGCIALGATLAAPLRAQAGKGLTDPNVAGEKDLLGLPHMMATIVKELLGKRPFTSAVDLNGFLLQQKLAPAAIADFYRQAFLQINLNTGSPEEFALIPSAPKNAIDEIQRGRPWKNLSQFQTTLGKTVGQAEATRLAMYVFVPINLNTATDEDILSVPGVGKSMLREFKEYRPWRSKAQFDKEIGKYVGPKETERLWRYVVIQ